MASHTRQIAVTGASGFVGEALVRALRARGDSVRTIGRDARSDVRWNPAHQSFEPGALADIDAVVHLAGAPIGERWTAARRRAILDSRVQGTALLAAACAASATRPRVLISASAIGVYGDRGDEWLTEASLPGEDYLASVCVAWERAAAAASDAGMRVVHPRLGIVLGASGGALSKLLPPFRFGVGGPAGTGRQWMSWIALSDAVRALLHLLDDERAQGAANVVAPEPATNADFARTLGAVLHRPAALPAPVFALELAFGEMARATILASQRVRSTVLDAAGFSCVHATLAGALRAELGMVS